MKSYRIEKLTNNNACKKTNKKSKYHATSKMTTKMDATSFLPNICCCLLFEAQDVSTLNFIKKLRPDISVGIDQEARVAYVNFLLLYSFSTQGKCHHIFRYENLHIPTAKIFLLKFFVRRVRHSLTPYAVSVCVFY